MNANDKDITGKIAAGAADKLREGGKAARRDAGELAGQVRHTAQEAREAIAEGASSTLATVREAAAETVDKAREALSEAGQRLAETLERTATQGEGDALKSRVLSSVAKGLTNASDTLRTRSMADLTSDIKTLAKRHPGAFMAAAAVAGFAAARFVRATSRQRLARHDNGLDQGPRV